MQAVLRLDAVNIAFLNATLRTVCGTSATGDARVGNLKSLSLGNSIAHCEVGAFDRVRAEIEILNPCILDAEDDANASRVTGINVNQIGLLLENHIFPMLLLIVGNGFGDSRETYHLLEFGQGMDLHTPVAQKLAAKVLAASGIEIDGVRLKVDCANRACLWCAMLIYSGKSENAHVAQFLNASSCVHHYSFWCQLTYFQHCGSGAKKLPL